MAGLGGKTGGRYNYDNNTGKTYKASQQSYYISLSLPTSVPTEVRIVGFCPHRSSFHVLSPFKCHSHSWGKERGSTGESVEPRHTQKHATIELLSPQKLLLKQGKIQTEFGTGILQLWKKHLGGVFVACGLDKGKNKRFGIGTHIYSF